MGGREGEKENIQGRGRKHVGMCLLGFFYLLIIKLTSKTKFENKYGRSIEVRLPHRFGKGKKKSRKKYGKILKLHYSVFLAVIDKRVGSST